MPLGSQPAPLVTVVSPPWTPPSLVVESSMTVSRDSLSLVLRVSFGFFIVSSLKRVGTATRSLYRYHTPRLRDPVQEDVGVVGAEARATSSAACTRATSAALCTEVTKLKPSSDAASTEGPRACDSGTNVP